MLTHSRIPLPFDRCHSSAAKSLRGQERSGSDRQSDDQLKGSLRQKSLSFKASPRRQPHESANGADRDL